MEKTTAKYYLIYNRRNKLNREGKAAIEIVVSYKGKQKFIATGIYIKPQFWDKKSNKVKNTLSYNLLYNQKLEEQIQKLRSIEYECVLQKKEFNLEMLKEVKKNAKYTSFNEFFRKEIETRKDIKDSTLKSHRVAYKSFNDFASHVNFDELNYNLIDRYDRYLREKEYKDHTIKTRHKTLKNYINRAIKKGFIKEDAYKNFKIREAKSNRKDLSFAQLEKLENISLKGEELELVRDLFLFSCYTGLRYEDVMDLSLQHLRTNKDGSTEIKKKVLKTGDEIRLPVSFLFKGKALEIIEKYKDEENEHIFPQRWNQSINRNLKILGHLIEFEAPLSFHIARHTFGSRLAELEPDPYLIKELMGHRNIQTSMIYIKTSSGVLSNKVKNINWK